jgi:hypothetical protein
MSIMSSYTWEDGNINGVKCKILKGSSDKRYNCAKYAKAKLGGKSPDCCSNDDHGLEVDDLAKELDEKIEDPNNNEYCRCMDISKCKYGEGPKKNCIVLYRSKSAKAGFHWAAFDSKRKDWGGKLTDNKPIVRFTKPEDYLRTLNEEACEDSEMVFYCKLDEGKYISDEELHIKSKACTD